MRDVKRIYLSTVKTAVNHADRLWKAASTRYNCPFYLAVYGLRTCYSQVIHSNVFHVELKLIAELPIPREP